MSRQPDQALRLGVGYCSDRCGARRAVTARIVVTGAASGIGAAVATRLVAAGNRVTVFDRDPGTGAPAAGFPTPAVDVRMIEHPRPILDVDDTALLAGCR